MKKMTFIISVCLLIFTISSHAQLGSKTSSITIENKSGTSYIEKVVAISWEQVVTNNPAIDTTNLKITDAGSGKEIAYQLEYAGNNNVQNLLVQVSVRSSNAIKLLLKNGKHAAFITKTYGRFVPERKDDFAWENDKIAFRMYGKALENTPRENAYGIDVWVKRTTRMILNERYKLAEYHVDHGDGMDYYHVGFTLGAGNMMPYVNDSIWYSKNYTQWKILDNGPLRFTFQLSYDAWEVAGKNVTAIKTISLDAGARLNKVSVEYKYDGAGNLPVVIGIIKRPEPGVELLNEINGILGYWEPRHGKDGTTGVGCIIPSAIKEMQVKKTQLLAFAEMKKNEPFIYYTGAVWDREGVIKNEKQWFDYLLQQQQLLTESGLVIRF